MAKNTGYRLTEHDRFESFLDKSGVSTTDLLDTGTLLQAAEETGADYVISGAIMEMGGSVMLLGRVIEVGLEAVLSVAQTILPIDDIVAEELDGGLSDQ